MPIGACGKDRPDRGDRALKKHAEQVYKKLETIDSQWGRPVFIRIVKTVDGGLKDGYLELFVEKDDGTYTLYDKWPICTYSGELGPKLKEGDGQSPEGFYFVTPGRMNPYSSYHLSFNLGYPNAFDRAHGRTGSYLMVHGNCVSIGCYAMTDEVIEEIFAIMKSSHMQGQSFIRVHVFPFPMTDENIPKYTDDPNIEFWKNLKTGWDWFETHKKPPNVDVRQKRYVFSSAD